MRFSLRTKTIAGVAAIEGFLLLLLIFTAISFLTNIIDEMLSKRASATAALFATATKDAVLSYDLASLESFTEELMENPDLEYVRIIGPDRQIFATRGSRALLARDFYQDQRLSDVDDGVFDTYSTINEDGFVFGRIELGISIRSTQAAIAKVSAWSLSIATIEMILVAGFSYFLGTFLMRQLKVLELGSKKVEKALKDRNFAHLSVPVRGNDELSDLAKAFNGLIQSLQQELEVNHQQQKELLALNSELEDKVFERTKDLTIKNNQLIKVNREIKETQQQLLQAEKMASVGQLAAGVAHEINNPIGFVTSNLSTLKDYVSAYQLVVQQAQLAVRELPKHKCPQAQKLGDLLSKEDFVYINEDIKELLDESKDGLVRVANIVQDLKLFSRVDRNEKQLFDLNACLKTTLNMLNNELKYKCEVVTDFGVIPQIMVNVGKLTQVFTNLLINASHAIKATESFGKITISTALQKNVIVIQIADTGIGIPAETLNKIFNPFFTTKPEGMGTGLGLSVSIGIIAELDGDISVDSEVGKGSCFTIKLPVKNTEEV